MSTSKTYAQEIVHYSDKFEKIIGNAVVFDIRQARRKEEETLIVLAVRWPRGDIMMNEMEREREK